MSSCSHCKRKIGYIGARLNIRKYGFYAPFSATRSSRTRMALSTPPRRSERAVPCAASGFIRRRDRIALISCGSATKRSGGFGCMMSAGGMCWIIQQFFQNNIAGKSSFPALRFLLSLVIVFCRLCLDIITVSVRLLISFLSLSAVAHLIVSVLS